MLNLRSSLVTAAVLVFASAVPIDPRQAASWPDPEPCTGNCSYVHDPSLVRNPDGTWYRFSTLGNIAIATAPAVTGPWTYQGAMLPQGSKINVLDGQQLWAPDVSLIGNTYYAYYAVSLSGSQASDIGVATSTSADVGSWTDHGSVGVPKNSAYNLIDPNLFHECDTCTPLWTFGSYWRDVFQTELNSDLTTWSGSSQPTNILYNSTDPAGGSSPAIVEGSFQFWWQVGNNKYYYLFFSSGICCDFGNPLPAPGEEYKIMVCRSDSATGPFVDQAGKNCLTENGGTLVLGSHGENVYAPGGQGVIQVPEVNKVALYYHYVNPNVGYDFSQYFFGFNYVDFSSGWPLLTS